MDDTFHTHFMKGRLIMSMPVIFVGHGSPMNAISDNIYTQTWRQLGQKINPKAILMVSAHWFTKGTYTQDEEEPKIVNDMYGFPRELYEVGYQVKGNQALTSAIIKSVSKPIQISNDWGLDHGAWSVLCHMYPDRNIPVVQLSVDALSSPEDHYKIGRELGGLRDLGILIIGSGNIVHNLRVSDMSKVDGYEWNQGFDSQIKEVILAKDHHKVLAYDQMEGAKLAVPTTDHFDPLLYTLGAAGTVGQVQVFNESHIMGGISMTGYLFD